MSLRSRAEYTPEWNIDKDDWRIRERIKYTPIKFNDKFKSSIHVEDELFFGLNNEFDYNRNRLGCGFESHLTEHITSDIYYFSEFKQGKVDWGRSDIFGLTLKYKF